jgi:hypothetical protein
MSHSDDAIANGLFEVAGELKALREGWHDIRPGGRADSPTFHDLHKLRCELMSIVSEQSSRLDGFVAAVKAKVAKVAAEISKLKKQLHDQDTNPGPISKEDQVLLTASVGSAGTVESDIDDLQKLLDEPPVVDPSIPVDPNAPPIDPNSPEAVAARAAFTKRQDEAVARAQARADAIRGVPGTPQPIGDRSAAVRAMDAAQKAGPNT